MLGPVPALIWLGLLIMPAAALRPSRLHSLCLRPATVGSPSRLLLHRCKDSPRRASSLHLARLGAQWRSSVAALRSSPWQFLSIPLVAGIVGYVTNWVGVKMLFFPTKWLGIPLYRVPGQPLGLLGWQGIVPAKRVAMATKLGKSLRNAFSLISPTSFVVDVTISRLISVREVFNRLEASRLATLLHPTVNPKVLGGWLPSPITYPFLLASARDLLRNIESVVDIRSLVVSGLTADPKTLGQFFQRVGRNELRFLVDSGFGIGVILGHSIITLNHVSND